MRLVDLLELLAPLAWIVAVVMIRAERKVVERFRLQGATAGERALALPELRGPRGWQARRLRSAGVIRTEDGSSCWLDEAAYRERRRARRRRALTVVAVLAAVLVVVFLVSR